jgi:hypothetical protein
VNVWTGRPSRLRAWVVGFSFAAWVLNFLAPLAHLPGDPGIGVAFFGVMGAAIAIPYSEREKDRSRQWEKERRQARRERERDEEQDGDDYANVVSAPRPAHRTHHIPRRRSRARLGVLVTAPAGRPHQLPDPGQ